jgi:RNA polymerase sigma-70 factor (ECF subfamily)
MEDIPRDILGKAQAGDMKAFERVYRATSGFVYNVALRILHNREEAQEVTQDVFLKIYRNLKYFQFRSSFKTWVYRITMNTAINAYRRVSREINRRQDFQTLENTHPAPDDIEKELTKQEEVKEQELRIGSLLSILNPEQRSCIVLREIEGLSYQEISQALNTNINTVRSRLKRAREALLAYSGGRSTK